MIKKDLVQQQKTVIHNTNGGKEKTHMIVLTDENNTFDNIHHVFIIC